ncbi:putative RNA-directed DNA polymerase from transposon BS [Trichonephila clavipes]|uniref:Putative RNA-directed DNA polymerase from transposon BS n=1 Tax=Trichonephila clavipes TaxID=2585209 RepID=A0A8X6V7Y8_TRICX|nr:putative RNA-directed DNA polymerase from transposon BS [Trichonephila clavipes]
MLEKAQYFALKTPFLQSAFSSDISILLQRATIYFGRKLHQVIFTQHLALRAGKRIKILKYISSRDWVLSKTLMFPSFPILCCSSDSILQKLERVQLSAARIITGLRNSCPKDIVLHEANLLLLSLRRNSFLVKYHSKFSSLGFQNRTSKFLES